MSSMSLTVSPLAFTRLYLFGNPEAQNGCLTLKFGLGHCLCLAEASKFRIDAGNRSRDGNPGDREAGEDGHGPD